MSGPTLSRTHITFPDSPWHWRTRWAAMRAALSTSRLEVLTYHGLRRDDSPRRNWMLLPQSLFRRHLEELRSRFEILGLDEALERLWRRQLRRPAVAITFDDGYANNLHLALPVLREAGVPATFFLATGLVGSGQTPWTARLDASFWAIGSSGSIDLRAHKLGVYRFATPAAARRVARVLKQHLKSCAPGARQELLSSILSQLPMPDPAFLAEFTFLTWAEVRAMEEAGLARFGAHTVNHEILSRLTDEQVDREIADSVAQVRARCAIPSSCFAYPNGEWRDFDARAVAAAERCGCRAAVSTIEGSNNEATHPMVLRRVSVSGDCDVQGLRNLLARKRMVLRALIAR